VSTLLFLLAAFVMAGMGRYLFPAQGRWVQGGLWTLALLGLALPLYLNLAGEPAVRELVWPFAAGLVIGERFASWLLLRLRTPASAKIPPPPKPKPRTK